MITPTSNPIIRIVQRELISTLHSFQCLITRLSVWELCCATVGATAAEPSLQKGYFESYWKREHVLHFVLFP